MNEIRRYLPLIGIFFLALVAAACQQASRERSEYVAGYGATAVAQGVRDEQSLLQGIMPPEQVRVEEYLNYYDQNFPAPPPGYSVGFNAELGNTFLPAEGGEAWLQIGLQAAEATIEDIRPLNIALVLDKSGSMQEADKMSYLKQSLNIFVDQLMPSDILSIVAYDDETQVVLSPQPVGDGEQVRRVIASLAPGGATNLHAGLMEGYRLVMENFSQEANNRVILFTDGNANRGVTDPDQIAADSLAYNSEGIFLSTIGLGLDFNDELLSKLAEQGKGNYYFVTDAEEMERIFKEEAKGLVQTVAKKVWLTLQLGAGVQVQRVYGYEYDLKEGVLRVQFDDAGAESTQILMIKVLVPGGEGAEQTFARASLTYEDVFSLENVELEQLLSYSYGAPSPYDPLVAPAVRRNATILRMAEALQQVGFLCQERRYSQALTLVQEVKPAVWKIATEEKDEQVQEDVTLLDNYETTLQKLVELASAPPQPEVVVIERRSGPCFAPLLWFGAIALFLGVAWLFKPSL